MSAYDLAVLLLFPGLGLVALAIGLLARRYSAAVLALGLTGLLALATASSFIAIAGGPATDTAQLGRLMRENGELKDVIARQQREIDAMPKAAALPAQDPNAGPRDGDTARPGGVPEAQGRRAAAEPDASGSGQPASALAARAAELEACLRDSRNAQAEAERRQAALEERLRDAAPRPAPRQDPDPGAIRRKLDDGDPLFYATNSERELIPGRRGSWHVVRLLRSGKAWEFADRQFALPDAAEIKAGVVKLRDDILIPLTRAGRPWRLFVRGEADARPVAGPVDRELTFLPRLPGGTYEAKPKGRRVTIPVTNEDLPNLRAEWLREIVRPALGTLVTDDIDILENPPHQEHGRTAVLVLFVDW